MKEFPIVLFDPVGYYICALGRLWPLWGTMAAALLAFCAVMLSRARADRLRMEADDAHRAEETTRQRKEREAWLNSIYRHRAGRDG